jgi:hypothetical protein
MSGLTDVRVEPGYDKAGSQRRLPSSLPGLTRRPAPPSPMEEGVAR